MHHSIGQLNGLNCTNGWSRCLLASWWLRRCVHAKQRWSIVILWTWARFVFQKFYKCFGQTVLAVVAITFLKENYNENEYCACKNGQKNRNIPDWLAFGDADPCRIEFNQPAFVLFRPTLSDSCWLKSNTDETSFKICCLSLFDAIMYPINRFFNKLLSTRSAWLDSVSRSFSSFECSLSCVLRTNNEIKIENRKRLLIFFLTF